MEISSQCMYYGQKLIYSFYNYETKRLQIKYKDSGGQWIFSMVDKGIYNNFINSSEKTRTLYIFNEKNQDRIECYREKNSD